MAWTHAVSEIVMGDRPVGLVDFTSRDLVYHIACEASIMGTIPQAMPCGRKHPPCMHHAFNTVVPTALASRSADISKFMQSAHLVSAGTVHT